jgi:hypothetical protein
VHVLAREPCRAHSCRTIRGTLERVELRSEAPSAGRGLITRRSLVRVQPPLPQTATEASWASVASFSIQFAARSFQPNHSGFKVLRSLISPSGLRPCGRWFVSQADGVIAWAHYLSSSGSLNLRFSIPCTTVHRRADSPRVAASTPDPQAQQATEAP